VSPGKPTAAPPGRNGGESRFALGLAASCLCLGAMSFWASGLIAEDRAAAPNPLCRSAAPKSGWWHKPAFLDETAKRLPSTTESRWRRPLRLCQKQPTGRSSSLFVRGVRAAGRQNGRREARVLSQSIGRRLAASPRFRAQRLSRSPLRVATSSRPKRRAPPIGRCNNTWQIHQIRTPRCSKPPVPQPVILPVRRRLRCFPPWLQADPRLHRARRGSPWRANHAPEEAGAARSSTVHSGRQKDPSRLSH
jgi:hypothetical protein